MNDAGQTSDGGRRRKLYLEAMGMSNEAYHLLGKAREISRQSAKLAKKN